MGLLMHQLNDRYLKIADAVYARHFVVDEKLNEEYDDRRKARMYEDILHNLSFLQAALAADDATIFTDYAKWLVRLMIAYMPDLPVARVKEQLLTHYDLLETGLREYLDQPEMKRVSKLLGAAKKITSSHDGKQEPHAKASGRYALAQETYFRLIKEKQSKAAITYIRQLYDHEALKLEEIFVDVLQPVLYNIGELWHQNRLTVDEEHYMSSITQVAMSQFYDVIFDGEKEPLTLLACAIGSELHEIGIRMIADLFENSGWQSHFLGAGMPEKYILDAIRKTDANLIALSVTMPQFLDDCRRIVLSIREAYPEKRIVVGGQAFTRTDKLYEKWPIDHYAKDARDLLAWTQKTFEVL